MNHLQERRKSRIMIVDRNLLVRQGMNVLLSAEADFEVAAYASELTDVVESAVRINPDILVMDYTLAEESAGSLAAIRQALPAMRILLVTPANNPETVQVAIACGARAYILRNTVSTHLAPALRALLKQTDAEGAVGLSQTVADLQALGKLHEQFPRKPVLTPREHETLRYLAKGTTVREIASELMLSPKTVEAHKLNLMRKLNVHNRAALIEYATENALLSAAS